MENKGYDIIGDIHGHASELTKLLEHLKYEPSSTGYHHKKRKAIFVGDFIDRGKEHKKLLSIVMTMVNHGHALAVMGNHEFNALAYHTLHEGNYLRPHTDKNTLQHQDFLNEYENGPELEEVLDFFYSLPLWLEEDGLRVVHACWDENHIEVMRNKAPDGKLNPDLLVEASTRDTDAYKAIEVLLKGIEVDLSKYDISFKDNDGHERTAVRIQWWKNDARYLGEVTLPQGLDIGDATKLLLSELPESIPIYNEDQPPCFIGHYWLEGEPRPLANNVACVDYSVAKDGKLVAYCWNGKPALIKKNFKHL